MKICPECIAAGIGLAIGFAGLIASQIHHQEECAQPAMAKTAACKEAADQDHDNMDDDILDNAYWSNYMTTIAGSN